MLPTLDEEGALRDIYSRIPLEELKESGYSTRVVVVMEAQAITPWLLLKV